MKEPQQTLKNHARLHPPYHFFLAPVLVFHLIWTVVRAVHDPDGNHLEAVLLALALFVMGALVRFNPLRAQDRLIRLEERLRFERVLGADLAQKASSLTPGQVVALRFAPDAELPSLIPQILSGQLTKPADIKKAIVNWRGDYFRV